MAHEKGTRVGAILAANESTVQFLGYGTYDGYRDGSPLFGLSNPHITLDDGSEVWGCQCWWGPEDAIQKRIGDRKVILVDVEGNVKEKQHD